MISGQQFEPTWNQMLLGKGMQRQRHQRSPNLSEIITILVIFHPQRDRPFKAIYRKHIRGSWRGLSRFGQLQPLCGMDAIRSTALVGVSEAPFWALLHRYQLHRSPPPQGNSLKNISRIEHSRHRRPVNFIVNVVCGLIAHCHQPKKPSLHFDLAVPSAT